VAAASFFAGAAAPDAAAAGVETLGKSAG